MAALVGYELVQGLEAEKRRLVVILVLDKGHNQGPEQYLYDSGVLLSVLGVVVKSAQQIEALAGHGWVFHNLLAQLLKGKLGRHVQLDVTVAFALFFNHFE